MGIGGTCRGCIRRDGRSRRCKLAAVSFVHYGVLKVRARPGVDTYVSRGQGLRHSKVVVEGVAAGLGAFAGLVGGRVGEQGVAGGDPSGGVVAEPVDDEVGVLVVPQFRVAVGAPPDGALLADEAVGDREAP